MDEKIVTTVETVEDEDTHTIWGFIPLVSSCSKSVKTTVVEEKKRKEEEKGADFWNVGPPWLAAIVKMVEFGVNAVEVFVKKEDTEKE